MPISRNRRRVAPKPKKVSYELIDPAGVIGRPMYAVLDELIDQHHEDLQEARIALAWCTSWKPDVDGRVTLGKCKKASDLDRELAAFDFIVLLARWFWKAETVTDAQRLALLDHELCHAALTLDANGEPAEDERGRRVYRIRKHDIEEFTAIVERHGCYKADIESFAAALRRSAVSRPFEPCVSCEETPGWVSRIDDQGVTRAVRCSCWMAWSGLRAELSA